MAKRKGQPPQGEPRALTPEQAATLLSGVFGVKVTMWQDSPGSLSPKVSPCLPRSTFPLVDPGIPLVDFELDTLLPHHHRGKAYAQTATTL
jgi:hypothetical protein